MFLRILPFLLTFVAGKLRKQQASKRRASKQTTAHRRTSYQRPAR
jgi:hypothetical protein